MAGSKNSGRRPKPTHLKLVENARDRRAAPLKGREPVPPGALDPASVPDWFNDEERSVWTEAMSSVPLGLLRRLDREVLVQWCEAVVTRREAQRKLRASSMLVKTTNGNVMQSPYLSTVNRQTEIIAKLAVEMGFTPSSRTKIALEEGDGAGGSAVDHYFR